MNSASQRPVFRRDLVAGGAGACLSLARGPVSVLTSVGEEERSHKASNQIGHTAVPITVDQHMQAHNQGEAAALRLGGEQSPPVL